MKGTVNCDNAWKQPNFPINISGLGVRQSQEQYRAAYVRSVLVSDYLVQKILNQRASDNRVFEELRLEPLQDLNLSTWIPTHRRKLKKP